jgi:hypothetical protein
MLWCRPWWSQIFFPVTVWVAIILLLFLICNLRMIHYFWGKSWANVRALKTVLVLFEPTSRLKVNYHKSMLVGINIDESWSNEAASVLSCKIGVYFFFLYLGLPIGGDSN